MSTSEALAVKTTKKREQENHNSRNYATQRQTERIDVYL